MIKRLLGNLSTNLVQLFVNMAVTFVMAPIYLRLMGHYDYGLREVVMALTGYMGLLSLGMQPTVSRFISMHHARSERDSMQSVYSTSLVFMTAVGLVCALFFWGWGAFFPHTLGPESSETAKYQTFLYLIGLQMLVLFPMFVTQSVIQGMQRFYVNNAVSIFFTLTIAFICYHYMTESNALILIISLTSLSVLLRLILFAGFVYRPQFGGLTIRVRHFSLGQLRELLTFGSKSMVQGVASKINNVSDRMVIGGILGPASVPLYTIPQTLMGYVNNITMNITQVFMPMFSDLKAKGSDERLRELYIVSSKYTVALVLAMSCGLAVIGPDFIQIWMPGEFEPELVAAIIYVLATYTAIHRLNPFAGHFLMAVNRHGFLAKVMPLGAILNLAVSLFLVSKIGVLGAALGTLVPSLILVPTILLYCCRHLGVKVHHYVVQSIFPALVPVLGMTAVILWMRSYWVDPGYMDLLFLIAAGAVTFIVLFWLIGCSRKERLFWSGLVARKVF